MDKLIRKLNPRNVDEVTLGEIERFIELKLNEHMKLRGQIARDMRRLGQDAFRDPSAYRKLREKYLRGHAGKKKLAILEMERQAWCE